MKAKEVLKILKITRPTLTKYVKSGKIKVVELPNGTYEYNEDDVLKLGGFTAERQAVVYARVSTQKQKKDLQNQISNITAYANKNGYKINEVYQDIASGLSYDRGDFMRLLKNVLNYKIKTIFVQDKDRFTRVSFNMWRELFETFNCKIIVVNDTNASDNEDNEIFSDIISLLHCFAMKMYSNKRKKKITLIEEDMINEIGNEIH